MNSIIWFKKDLRISDHLPLISYNKSHKIIPLYIIEPLFWQEEDASNRHFQFLHDCLTSLNTELENLGGKLIIKIGEAEEILAKIISKYKVNEILAHQETGNNFTYQRDLKIISLCQKNNIKFKEFQQFGVIRALKSRDKWSKYRDEIINQTPHQAPKTLPFLEGLTSDKLPDKSSFGSKNPTFAEIQKGGRKAALSTLKSFLQNRGKNYQFEMSSPLTATTSCSRISPYISYGCISLREINYYLNKKTAKLKENKNPENNKWLRSLYSFRSRLYWHCHFIQKLEDEPEIEYEAIHKSYNNWPYEQDNPYFKAWCTGKTGFPFIDSCMRSLIATGWLNFRMRAMLVSFASYQLNIDWRLTAKYLAKLFTDYEPGIHYSQIQMQSNNSGINIPRIYNPIKQSYDQDKNGIFIKKWLPELKNISEEFIHEPWKIKNSLQEKPDISSYPEPIINLEEATKQARERIKSLRKSENFGAESARVLLKHGSRKTRTNKKTRKKPVKETKNQLTLDL